LGLRTLTLSHSDDDPTGGASEFEFPRAPS